MPRFEITYIRDCRLFSREVEADGFEEADAMCGQGEFVSGQIIQTIPDDDATVEHARKRIREALREVSQ